LGFRFAGKRGRGKRNTKRRGEGGRGKEKEEGKEGGYIQLKKNKKNPAPPHYYTVAPAGKPPAGASGGIASGAARQWPPHLNLKGAIAEQAERGANFKKPFLRFSNT
jgi:hypothetical protein